MVFLRTFDAAAIRSYTVIVTFISNKDEDGFVKASFEMDALQVITGLGDVVIVCLLGRDFSSLKKAKSHVLKSSSLSCKG